MEVKNDIKIRYSKESKGDSVLSCGNNLESLKLVEGEKVLDLGCGRGHDAIEAAKIVGESGFVWGLDITPDMIKVAKENAKGVSNVDFISGDIEILPFEDKSFDVVTSNCVINHARDKQKVYKEIYRVLRDGGRFVISDAVTKEPLADSIKSDPAQWAACFGGAVTKEEYFQSINSAGFENVETLKSREYIKNGYDFISLTIRATKKCEPGQGGDNYEEGH